MVDRNNTSTSVDNPNFQRSNNPKLSSLADDLITEWTIKAQLKCKHAGETVRREYRTTDSVNPVKVFSKYYNSNDNAAFDENVEQTPSVTESIKIDKNVKRAPYSDVFVKSCTNTTHPSFHGDVHSTTSSTTCDDFHVGSTLSGPYDEHVELRSIRCQSTCNVVLSAVVDFLPMTAVSESTGKNTSGNNKIYFDKAYTSTDDQFTPTTTPTHKVISGKDLQQNIDQSAYVKTNLLCDAICQTSDVEQKQPKDRKKLDILNDCISGLLHNQINMTDIQAALMQRHHFMPSFLQSSSRIFKSISMPCMPFSNNNSELPIISSVLPFRSHEKSTALKSEPSKKSRTVHIDVYCTGSEDENQADIESSSSQETDLIKYTNTELTSPYQTILNNDQVNLKHQRVQDKKILPRRLLKQQKSFSDKEQKLRLRSPLARSKNDADYLCNQQETQKLQNLRQKYFHQTKDNYAQCFPMHDYYESNASSIIPTDNLVDICRKESYDSNHSSIQEYMCSLNAGIKNIKEKIEESTHQSQEIPADPKNCLTKQNLSHHLKSNQILQNSSKFLQFFCPNKQKTNLNCTVQGNTIKTTTSDRLNTKESAMQSSQHKWHEKYQQRQHLITNNKTFSMPVSDIELKRFNMSFSQTPLYRHINELNLTGYSNEYLGKARKFGEVVRMKKPDHHVGPPKSPNCLCESCERWKTQRLITRDIKHFSLNQQSYPRKL